jgi:Sec-independent protein translocase protein TatA
LFDELSNKVDLLFGNKNLKEAIEQVRKDLLDNRAELSDNNQEENLGESPELPDGDLSKNKDKNEETLKNNLKELFGGDRLLR